MAGAHIDGALVCAGEVALAWWLLWEWEVRLALCDDGWLLLLRLVDDGL